MKKQKPNYYIDAIGILMDIKKKHPSYTLGRHLSTALDEYGDIWGLPDKEIVYALVKYQATLAMDVFHETDDAELQKIIEDGMNLSINTEDEDYG